eukprot:PLAT248.1.p1 GENE.PLAT248.1~~PLAT248.1.p1  ORF type:complete len:508 (-),score=215.31 PLAT248.1:60-1541(-)
MASVKAPPTAVFTFLTVNDVYRISRNAAGWGGIAELTAMVRAARDRVLEAGGCPIFTVNGDFLSASRAAATYEGAHMIRLLNAAGVDYVVVGNHEFDFGEEVLATRIAESDFTWLGSNVDVAGKPLPGLQRTATVEHNGVRLGLFGLCTPATPVMSYPGPDVRFGDPIDEGLLVVDELRATGADVIVGLTHLRFEADRELARRLKGVAALLGGHDHTPGTFWEGGTLLHKSGQDASWLGEVELSVWLPEEDGAAATVVHSWRMVPNRDAAADEGVAAIVAEVEEAVRAAGGAVGRELAMVHCPLDSRSAFLRTRETSWALLVADALRARAGADVGIINGGFIRADRLYEPGTMLTDTIVQAELPFPRPAVKLRLTGAALRSALEGQLRFFPEANGAFPHVSGLHVEVDTAAPPGSRVRLLARAETPTEPLDEDALLTCAVTKFMADGGDGVDGWKEGELLWTGSTVADELTAYLDDVGELLMLDSGRLVLIED